MDSIPFLNPSSEYRQSRGLVGKKQFCLNVIFSSCTQVASKKLTPDQVAKIIELNAYLTVCKLQPYHQFLALRSAMGACFKAENFVTAASFAKRMVQGNFGPPEKTKDDVLKARQVLQICEQKGTDKHTINYDPKAAVEDIKICAGSLEAIGAQDTPVYCPYCGAIYKPEFKGKLCDVCNLSEIGANTLGIQLRPIWVESDPPKTEKTLQQLSRTPQWNMLRGRPLDFGTTQLKSAKKKLSRRDLFRMVFAHDCKRLESWEHWYQLQPFFEPWGAGWCGRLAHRKWNCYYHTGIFQHDEQRFLTAEIWRKHQVQQLAFMFVSFPLRSFRFLATLRWLEGNGALLKILCSMRHPRKSYWIGL